MAGGGLAGAGPAVERARRLARFPPSGTAVTCAVSGGADSVALLALAVDAGLRVEVVHVDHRLRPDSAVDAAVASAAAERFAVPCRVVAVDVAPGGDLEARARIARHGALPAGSLLGHTADDQAETVLLALLRGTGVDGLAAMDPATHPILGLRRRDTHAVCAELGLDVVHDPANDDPRFRRNRVRAEVLPLLDDVAERDVVPLLARLAALAADDVAELELAAGALDPTDARALAAAPPALARRAVRRWLRRHLPETHPPDAAAVARVLDVASGATRATEVRGGIEVRRSGQRLELRLTGGEAGS